MGNIRCAVCRQVCRDKDSLLLRTKAKVLELETAEKEKQKKSSKLVKQATSVEDCYDELTEIGIEGECNSAKVEGVVKCVIKIINEDKQAKCLIYSEHQIILELISGLLNANFIRFKYIKDTNMLKENVHEFKTEPFKVLLMPYSIGASGLNLTEANHVLLVEPTLSKAQEVQAIGVYILN